jgi:glycosyltransferase involved in cell wall biosynthesis
LAESTTGLTADDGSIAISLVIPAYNEAGRIAATLNLAVDALESLGERWELLIVDDGSTDSTASIAKSLAQEYRNTHVISLPHRGKASSVAHGLAIAKGDFVIFSDADLATPLRYLKPFIDRSRAGADVVIASREGFNAIRIGEPEYRHLMGRVFNRLVQWLLLPGIQDTQCGFKLFTREAAQEITQRTLLYKDEKEVTGARVTAFDVEMLVIARRLGYRIDAIQVEWVYGTNSKVNPLRDSIQNGRDLLTIKLNDVLGKYRR